MLKYLVNNVATIRVEDLEEAEALHQYYEDYARENDYILSGWSQTLRTKKAKGEIIDSWYICKVTLVFNDAKEPAIPLDTIDFKMLKSYDITQTPQFKSLVEE